MGGVTILAMLSVLLAPGASAKTYTCDNDPVSGSGCSDYNGSTFVYKSNQSSSYNDDHRLSTAQDEDDYYIWYFDEATAGTPEVYVYLNSASFTNREAHYYLGTTDPYTSEYVGAVNQYTADEGWNFVGDDVTVSGDVELMVIAYDYDRSGDTGADAARLVY
ncbi:hypothetical protein FOI68_03645 [Brevibacillus sp. LEMMJ03]|uniref:hypothetical protein n=1 Tax=Brevibacillus sp. LEMMJ03 TaxID=2595056 RepID=UPI00118139E2|nr:hypothetical protein [Brevibacillus sp. LEMMJ03]TRY27461.1 hypothetical protein FOI68_03645 [Brevibacillus sp. LEMMJ03]